MTTFLPAVSTWNEDLNRAFKKKKTVPTFALPAPMKTPQEQADDLIGAAVRAGRGMTPSSEMVDEQNKVDWVRCRYCLSYDVPTLRFGTFLCKHVKVTRWVSYSCFRPGTRHDFSIVNNLVRKQ